MAGTNARTCAPNSLRLNLSMDRIPCAALLLEGDRAAEKADPPVVPRRITEMLTRILPTVIFSVELAWKYRLVCRVASCSLFRHHQHHQHHHRQSPSNVLDFLACFVLLRDN
jgi:hypothetical protein